MRNRILVNIHVFKHGEDNKIPVKTSDVYSSFVGRGFVVLYIARRKLRIKTVRQFSAKSGLENKSHNTGVYSRGDLYKGEKLLCNIWQKNYYNRKLLNTQVFRLLRHNDI